MGKCASKNRLCSTAQSSNSQGPTKTLGNPLGEIPVWAKKKRTARKDKGKESEMEKDETRNHQITFLKFSWRITSLHTIAYSLAGLTALITMHYKMQFTGDFLSGYMKPFTSPMIALGPILQLINGFIMSIFLYPLAAFLIDNIKNSKKILFLLLAGFSFFTPQVPGIGNFEGLVYTKAPLFVHLIGIPECLIYSGLFAVCFSIWYKTERKWINILSIILVILIGLMSTLGYLDSIGLLPKK